MDEFLKSLEGAHPNACVDEAERVKAIDALFAALRRFQRPFDVAWDHSWTAPLTHSAVRALIDAGVFTAWDKAGGGTKSSAELAELTGTDPVLISSCCPPSFSLYSKIASPLARIPTLSLARNLPIP